MSTTQRARPRFFRAPWIAILALAACPSASSGQAVSSNPDLLSSPWTARWISHPTADREAFGVFHFRTTFTLAAAPDRFVVHVSADNRYRLFVNGAAVARGPARGDVARWRFESVDIAPQMKAGKNVLAAVVWNFGDNAPMAQHTVETAFILQGDTDLEEVANTDAGWRVYQNPAYQEITMTQEDVDWYFAVGPGERIDGSQYPWGWESPGFDDTDWPAALPVATGYPRGITSHGELPYWMLVPRDIPAMEESPLRLQALRRAEGVEAHDGFLRGDRPLQIPARTKATLLVDQGHLTTSYPELAVSGGKGASITLRYAESLFHERRQKGNRDEVEGKMLYGNFDTFVADGGEQRRFEPLWFRTYRYIQVEIETAQQPLVLHDLRGAFTAYPFQQNASFLSADSDLGRIWDVAWRTARLCAGEHYYDCPYYEQLQYVGDTRIQALISLFVSGDDLLVRRSLRDFDHSRIPEGITASRYPSRLPQYIPTYALFWVSMIHDYWMLRDDPDFVEGFLTGVRGVLDWYDGYVDEQGLVSATPWWNFVDWAPEFPSGVPPGTDDGPSCLISLQVAYTLNQAAELADAFGRPDEAGTYRTRREALEDAAFDQCWDADRMLFSDAPRGTAFSQHANLFALLAGTIPPHARHATLERIIEDDSLVQATFYFQFYLHEALRRAGMADGYLPMLDGWREMLDLGLTTFAEKPEPTRSDCHAWSASPNYFLLSLVAGIGPEGPGFRRVRIEPAMGPLEWLEARMPHPAGEIHVRLERRGEDGLEAQVTLPEGLEGSFHWGGQQRVLTPGAQEFRF